VAAPGILSSGNTGAKQKKTLQFGRRESYDIGGSPTARTTAIPAYTSQAGESPVKQDSAPAQFAVARNSVKRCSVVSTGVPVSSDSLKRSSVASTVSEFWEDDTIDEDQVKACQKLANKLAVRKVSGTAKK
jgi:hypothetical protein